MSSYYRNKDLSCRSRKSVSEWPSSNPSYDSKSFRQDRPRGDASEIKSVSETLGHTSYYTHRELDSGLNKTTDFASKDYKKLYEEALGENEKLKTCLAVSKQDLAKFRLQLDEITQEKQVLIQRVAEMEEELKVFGEGAVPLE